MQLIVQAVVQLIESIETASNTTIADHCNVQNETAQNSRKIEEPTISC